MQMGSERSRSKQSLGLHVYIDLVGSFCRYLVGIATKWIQENGADCVLVARCQNAIGQGCDKFAGPGQLTGVLWELNIFFRFRM